MNLQPLDQREVGLKLSWPFICFYSHWYDQYLCCQNTDVDFQSSLIPLYQTFYPWSSKEAPENVWMSFLFTHPREDSPVWCWANEGKIHTLWCSISLIPFWRFFLQGICREPSPLSSYDSTERSPLCRSNEKKSVLWEDSWASCPLVPHEVGRDTFSNLLLHFIHFPPLTVPSLSSSPSRL